ncbi:Growth hormone-inducible transmembrane protein [Geodia barretti]|uniref:Growth hormone-inducible transmembrane protein n=1 Tax=Geodia barretti TaxID=519541 RepID=A0AA35RPW6_GEOBA|nr:Growth hormone-inducible transmembrane protein [Geodia barretti]
MLAFTISKSAVALCRPAQLGVGRGGREMVGRLWRRLASGEVRTVRAVPVEGSGLRARFGGDNIGRAILGGGALFGVGSLCFYGLGLSNEAGAIDRARFWPEAVRQRVSSTYTSFASGLGVTSVAAFAATRATSVMRFMAGRPMASMLLFGVGSIGSALLCYSVPYTPETLPAKIGAFTLFTSIMGLTMAPLVAFAGPLVGRAALYTAGVVGGLSLTAACAPSDKYLKWGGPLALGLGVVFVSSIGGMFAAPGGAIFSALHTVYMYGGLVLFGGFLLYDTQKIVHHAEHDHHYDPVNMSMGIYLDTVNIFIRILSLMAGSGNKRR